MLSTSQGLLDQSHLEDDASDRSARFSEARSFDASLLEERISFAQIKVKRALNAHVSLFVHQACLMLESFDLS